jgi:hypothetical protein
MDLETTCRELMKSAYLAIALVPALGAIPDDSLATDVTALDVSDPSAESPGFVTDEATNTQPRTPRPG